MMRRIKKAPRKYATSEAPIAIERLSDIDLLKLQNAAQAVELAQMRHQAVVQEIWTSYKLKPSTKPDGNDGDIINPDGTILRR